MVLVAWEEVAVVVKVVIVAETVLVRKGKEYPSRTETLRNCKMNSIL